MKNFLQKLDYRALLKGLLFFAAASIAFQTALAIMEARSVFQSNSSFDIDYASGVLLESDSPDVKAQAAMNIKGRMTQETSLVLNGVFGVFISVATGFVTARFSSHDHIFNCVFLGCAMTALSAPLSLHDALLWLALIPLITTLPCFYLGGVLALKKTRKGVTA